VEVLLGAKRTEKKRIEIVPTVSSIGKIQKKRSAQIQLFLPDPVRSQGNFMGERLWGGGGFKGREGEKRASQIDSPKFQNKSRVPGKKKKGEPGTISYQGTETQRLD